MLDALDLRFAVLAIPGHTRTHIAYLAPGILFPGDTLFSAGSPIPLVGASGAISGVLGFYLVWFPRHTVKVWVFLFPIYMGMVHISATIVLVAYLLIDNLLPFLLAPVDLRADQYVIASVTATKARNIQRAVVIACLPSPRRAWR